MTSDLLLLITLVLRD